MSLFAGLDAHVHRVTVHNRHQPRHTVFESLADDGYATGLFSENGFLTGRDAGLADPFETTFGVPDDYDDRYDTTMLDHGPDSFYYAEPLYLARQVYQYLGISTESQQLVRRSPSL